MYQISGGGKEYLMDGPGRPGGERWAGAAKTVGGAIPLPGDLPFFRTLSGTFKSDLRIIFGRAFGGSRGQRWPVGEKLIFTFKASFISAFMERFVFALRYRPYP